MTNYKNFSPFLDKDNLPWGDINTFIDGYKRNVELISVTQQIALEAAKSVMQLQTQYLKGAFDQVTEQTQKGFTSNINEDSFANQSDLGKATVDKAVQHASKINAVITQSNEKIYENIQKRFNEGVKESASAVKKSTKAAKKTAKK